MKIIKFGAIWCPACLIMNKRLKNILKDNSVELISYDYDIDTEEKEAYHIDKILPVLIFLDDQNEEITRLIGEHSEDEIRTIIARK